MVYTDIRNLIIIITLVFLLAPAFIIVYIFIYNKRKREHIAEKERMKQAFATEITQAQLEIQEQTMQTIGADLHDNIGQLLSLTAFTLKSVDEENIGGSMSKVEAATELVSRSISELRLLGKLLHGEQLIHTGLQAAIEHEIAWIEKLGKFSIGLEVTGTPPGIKNVEKELIIFRIVQEALNNCIKHAKASAVMIRLNYLPQTLELSISDNGIGFNTAGNVMQSNGMGLHNIQRRAALLNGQLAINSSENSGTAITLQIPYE